MIKCVNYFKEVHTVSSKPPTKKKEELTFLSAA